MTNRDLVASFFSILPLEVEGVIVTDGEDHCGKLNRASEKGKLRSR